MISTFHYHLKAKHKAPAISWPLPASVVLTFGLTEPQILKQNHRQHLTAGPWTPAH